ncbi:MAG: bifunctional (p)ppGpp synthetase/guanosine-3',5'-bis(diphosphate) 3'-pyrophosphohydrolase [Erysipelotrichales bacterium]|nr:bifunctional (p)ppGpp synthetase/guanosine-3',5'-bis(diphosphate) 3'-pyrophosphohydrolase [Erysipelotrichales bacterium]
MDTQFLEVLSIIETYIHCPDDLMRIRKAYEVACEKHKDQFRKSGVPYISHPIEVSRILADMKAGPNTIIAGLLHDILEDTPTTLNFLEEEFSKDVAQMVEGVTKINEIKVASLEKAQIENHQKMLLAMSQDIRVILIKIADRLHNLRTMEDMSRAHQIRKGQETLEIYAPIAHKLGMFKLKAELEDRSFRYINPEAFEEITKYIEEIKNKKELLIEDMSKQISGFLENSIPNFAIKGRTKNVYSIYKKTLAQGKKLDEIYDIFALRIILDKIEHCYSVLGTIHAHFVPLPNKIKDYIAVPKDNMYQSLHTTIIVGGGQFFEVQIRTREMDDIAENGIAAHWSYKENSDYSREKEQREIAEKLKWYGDLLKMSETSTEYDDAQEFLDSFKGDILEANVYVYTPKGEVIDLPKGATPLDFAYKIHTDLGHRTIGALVNNKMVTLDYELSTGDVVSIKTSKNSGPSESWLKIVKSTQAKHKIKNYLNKLNHDNLLASGKSELEKDFTVNRVTTPLTDAFVTEHFSKNKINNIDELYIAIGKGLISPKTVLNKILGTTIDKDENLRRQIERTNRIITTNSQTGVFIEGLDNPQIKLANCCYPIPREEIIGYVSKGAGVIVHCKSCMKIKDLPEARFITVLWATNITRKYPVKIKIIAVFHRNNVSDLIAIINSHSFSIGEVKASTNYSNLEEIIKFKLIASSRQELDTLMVNIKKMSTVISVEKDSN